MTPSGWPLCAPGIPPLHLRPHRLRLITHNLSPVDSWLHAPDHVGRRAQANEYAEAVRVAAASRVEQLASALTAAGVPVPAEASLDYPSIATAAGDGEQQAAAAEALLQKSAFQTELENARQLMRQALGMQDDSTR